MTEIPLLTAVAKGELIPFRLRGSRTLRGPGIPKGNGQVIYSNTIPDRLSCITQLSKMDSSLSIAGEQARHPSNSRQLTPTEGRKRRGVHRAAGVNPCILLAWSNVLPMLSLFSLSINNSKRVIATLQLTTTKPKSQTLFSGSLVITLWKLLNRGLTKFAQKCPMRVTNAAALRHLDEKGPKPTGEHVLQAVGTTADSDSRSVGVHRRSTLELESLVTQLAHSQQTNHSSWGPNLQQGDTNKARDCPNSNVSIRRLSTLITAS
ncbi:hypothetical protein CRG98_012632 [Punica granatum]|uniref:Uncharacterized protein n=1 Tax=Punica granatum TaxID=22663 RepID=A0A2I0KEN2_PUNGR|nr:hypothetical protein CRG98_012632 [Punica granatum]